MEQTYEESELTQPICCQFTTAMEAGNNSFHLHNCYEIYLLLDGEISYFVEQSCYHLHPGDMMIFTNQEVHKAINRKTEPFTRMVIHLNPLFVWRFCTGLTNLLRCFHQNRPGMDNMISLAPKQQELFKDYFLQMAQSSESDEYGSDIRSMTALINLLLMINEHFLQVPQQAPETYVHRLHPVMTYIDRNLSAPITLDFIAQTCSMDKYYMSHLFKKDTGSTIFQYILVKRVALAKELLSLGATVHEACLQSGFHDYANFIRTFKKVTGFSPGHFKKLNLSNV